MEESLGSQRPDIRFPLGVTHNDVTVTRFDAIRRNELTEHLQRLNIEAARLQEHISSNAGQLLQ